MWNRWTFLLLATAAAADRQLALECQNTQATGPDELCTSPFALICGSGLGDDGVLEIGEWGHSCLACGVLEDGTVDGCPTYAPLCVDRDGMVVPPGHVRGKVCTSAEEVVCRNTRVGLDEGCTREAPVCVLESGHNPLAWAAGTQCVQCVSSFFHRSAVDEGCTEETPNCVDNVCVGADFDADDAEDVDVACNAFTCFNLYDKETSDF